MAKEEVLINAEKRNVTGKQVKALRRQGLLPGVIYGRHIEAFPIQMDAHDASLILDKLTASSLITIDVDGEKFNVLMRDRQRDVIFGDLLHVDFLVVSLTEKLRATVELKLVGEAPVADNPEVVVTQVLNAIEIEALPQDLPEVIEVDISTLETVDDEITVADLDLGEDIAILTDPNETIVSVGYVAQEEVAEEEEAEELAEPKVVERGKKEAAGEEAEGEEA
ncbi:MAG TPA: 50S ribosomal protein L25 [Anaerolineaceae bacterium]|nr:50S ribosomal protein L25 [Anaerolineaceae bacterium]HPK26482.1 50S ribosomal protein L25 [Anaerolineaceae bacterium]HQM65706.1 50S ribosomal protein L25 [Anaerolineaceae bacterium]